LLRATLRLRSDEEHVLIPFSANTALATTSCNEFPTLNFFFDQLLVSVKLHLDFNLLKAPAAPHQHLSDKENLAVIFEIVGKVIGKVNMTLNDFAAAVACDREIIKICWWPRGT
jgi:hypothetical protein